jgi:hypothetical protein
MSLFRTSENKHLLLLGMLIIISFYEFYDSLFPGFYIFKRPFRSLSNIILIDAESIKLDFLDKEVCTKLYQHVLAFYIEMIKMPDNVSNSSAEAMESF